MAKEYDSRLADKFVLRLPENLRDQVRDLAQENNRSMNAQFVEFIERGVAAEGGAPSFPVMADWTPQVGMLVEVYNKVGSEFEWTRAELAALRGSGYATLKLLDHNGYCDDFPLEKIRPARLQYRCN